MNPLLATYQNAYAGENIFVHSLGRIAITDSDKEMIGAIYRCAADTAMPPHISEICRYLNGRGTEWANEHLFILRAKGLAAVKDGRLFLTALGSVIAASEDMRQGGTGY